MFCGRFWPARCAAADHRLTQGAMRGWRGVTKSILAASGAWAVDEIGALDVSCLGMSQVGATVGESRDLTGMTKDL